MSLSLQEYLEGLGYRLRDNGKEWSAQAIYRGGDNPTALSINKKTGVFYDFVAKIGGTFKQLVELTKGEAIEDFEAYVQELGVEIELETSEKPKLMQEKTWPVAELDKLLPHYKFYEERGISKNTLRFFKSGLAHSGSMLERYVFPIFNQNGLIHGWSGRDMTGKKEAKWKHIGGKRNWVYPLYVYKEVNGTKVYPVQEAIFKSKEVILVESIGDMMALWERGVYNVLVTFGLVLPSKLCSYLMGLNLKRIVIATNNDFSKKENRGKMASLTMYCQLMSYVDFNKIVIALPSGVEDFGEITDEGLKKWREKVENPNMKVIHQAVLEYLRNLYKKDRQKVTKSQVKVAKAIASLYDKDLQYFTKVK